MEINGVLGFATYNDQSECLYLEPCSGDVGTSSMVTLMYKGECNFDCQFCLWHTLTYHKQKSTSIDKLVKIINDREDVTAFLVSGMEPTQFDTLLPMVRAIKSQCNVLIRLDTNGTNPVLLEQLFSEGLIDYVAMDVKAPPDKYELVTQVEVDTDTIKQSIELIKAQAPRYKFRTTVARELLTAEDVNDIIDWIEDTHAYEVKDVWDSPKIKGGTGQFHPLTSKEKDKIVKKVKDKKFDSSHFAKPRSGLGVSGGSVFKE